jgi:hypothetical protein
MMYAHHFSINNIPFGIASSSSHPGKAVATRFEDTVIFLDELAKYHSSLSTSTVSTFSFVCPLSPHSVSSIDAHRKHSTPSPHSQNHSIRRQGNGYNPTSLTSPPSHHLLNSPSQKPIFIYHCRLETLPISPALAPMFSTPPKPYLESAHFLLDSNISPLVTMVVPQALFHLGLRL